jgi:glycosyltransferase involved in cell wall biosynthesis
MNVVVFTGHRPEKLAHPLASVSNDVAIVSCTSESLLRRWFETLRDGQQAIDEHDPEVIIGDHAGVVSFAAAILAAINSVGFVLRLGGDIWTINRSQLRESYKRRNYRQILLNIIVLLMNRIIHFFTDGYLAISESVEQSILTNTATDPSRIGRIRVPVDIEAFSTSEGINVREQLEIHDAPVILTVTNLRFKPKYEALRDALPAIRVVMSKHKNTNFLIAGDGAYLDSLREDIANEFPPAIAERIHLLGFVEDVPDLYATADAFVYFSYAEGFGNIIQEAMAAECPILANEHEGLAEQINHGETGLLVPTPDDGDVCIQIERLLFNTALRKHLIGAGRERVTNVATPSAVGESALDELERIVASLEE